MKVRYSRHINSDIEESTGHSFDNIDVCVIIMLSEQDLTYSKAKL